MHISQITAIEIFKIMLAWSFFIYKGIRLLHLLFCQLLSLMWGTVLLPCGRQQPVYTSYLIPRWMMIWRRIRQCINRYGVDLIIMKFSGWINTHRVLLQNNVRFFKETSLMCNRCRYYFHSMAFEISAIFVFRNTIGRGHLICWRKKEI